MRKAWPFLAPIVVAGCLLPGFERDEVGTTSASTASGSTTSTTGAGGFGGTAPGFCETATFPAPPGPTGAGGGVDLDLAMALRTLDLGETAPDARPGFDLDRVCSCCTDCQTDGDACTPPAFATPGAACDVDSAGTSTNAGRDNALALVIASFGMVGSRLPVGSQTMTDRAENGQWSLLVRVSGYNGLPDDDQVSVSLFTTDGLMAPPVWNGLDVWPIRPDSLASDYALYPDPRDAATVLNPSAYVTGGRLVGVFDGAEGSSNRLSLNLNGGFALTLTTAIFTADLVEGPSGWRLDNGTMGGVWNLTDVFKSLSAIRPPLCTDDSAYVFFKSRLCQYVDIRSGPPSPQPCDALSFGLSFTADPIVFGPVSPPVTPEPGCTAETDPVDDTCP